MQVVKNFLYNVSYQLLIIILPLITVPYVSNILGSQGVGDYAFTNSNMRYFIIFGMMGIGLYGNRQIAYVRENKEELQNTFFSIYSMQLITTTISFIAYLIFALVFSNSNYRILYIAQGINILGAMFDISWLFMGLEQFKKTVVRNTLIRLISLVSIFIFVKNSDDTVIYTIILGLSTFIGNLTFWVYIPKMFDFKKVKINGLKKHVKASLALFVPQIAIQIYLLLDRTILGILTDNIQVGYYDNSQKLVKLVLTIATAVGTVMMPKISNTVASGNIKRVKYYIENSFFFVSALSIPLMFGLMGIAPELSPWFFGNNFNGIENLIIISSVIILAISWSNVLGLQLLVPLNRTKEFTISVTAGAVVNFILNLIVIRHFGAIGACLATIIAEFTVTIIQFYFVRDFIKPKKIIGDVIIFIIPSIIMYIIMRKIGSVMGIGILSNIVQGSIGIIIYFVLLEVSYRIFNKQSIIIYIKGIVQ